MGYNSRHPSAIGWLCRPIRASRLLGSAKHRPMSAICWTAGSPPPVVLETGGTRDGGEDVDVPSSSIVGDRRLVVPLLPWVLLMIPVMVLAITSLVVPSRRQCHLLTRLDRLVKIAAALRGSDKVGPQKPRPSSEVVPLISRSLLVSLSNLPLPRGTTQHPQREPASGTTGTPSKSTAARGDVVKDDDWSYLRIVRRSARRLGQRLPRSSPSHACESPRRPQRDRTILCSPSRRPSRGGFRLHVAWDARSASASRPREGKMREAGPAGCVARPGW